MWGAIIPFVAVAAVKGLFSLFSSKPKEQNNTNADLEKYYQLQADTKKMIGDINKKADESKQQANEARAREQKAIKKEKEAKEREAEARRYEKEAKSAAEQAWAAAREAAQQNEASKEREAEANRREEEARRLAEEANRLAAEAQKREEEARASEREARQREEQAKKAALKAQEQAQQTQKDLERANFHLSKGIQPEVWPTEEEFQSAKTRIEYDPEKLHLAICGSSGSGKSSLINAFRGLKNHANGAASTGVTETTMSTTRYPDPHKEIPRSRFVWYDVPGAGTLNVPGWQYFNEQGLFIFDIIILVYDSRFTQIDVTIIQHCERYRIPLFLVRSKADVQIKSILGDKFGYDEGEEDAEEKYKEHHSAARQLLIDSTKKDLDRNFANPQANLAKRPVFIISSHSLYALMTDKRNWRTAANVIDEINLLEEILKAAHSRRYGDQASTKDHSTVVKQNMAESQSNTNSLAL